MVFSHGRAFWIGSPEWWRWREANAAKATRTLSLSDLPGFASPSQMFPIGCFFLTGRIRQTTERWKSGTPGFLLSPVSFPLPLQNHVPPAVGALPDGERDLHVLLHLFRDLLGGAQIRSQGFIQPAGGDRTSLTAVTINSVAILQKAIILSFSIFLK